MSDETNFTDSNDSESTPQNDNVDESEELEISESGDNYTSEIVVIDNGTVDYTNQLNHISALLFCIFCCLIGITCIIGWVGARNGK